MATLFSPCAILSISNSSTPNPLKPPQPQVFAKFPPPTITFTAAAATAAAALIISTGTISPLALADESPSAVYTTYYGTAASAANYGGYGGNSSKKDSAEYIYDVPQGWKERLVSKVEKGTNGTDSEFYNPKKKTEKEYLTYLAGFRALAPKEVVLNNLALSDVNLQDQIASADTITSEVRRDDTGQVYYEYEIGVSDSHSLISVTCANNKLYAHFVNAPAVEWKRDQDMLRHIHQSFKTIGS
ncbi:hypothetical protein RND81_11G120300 [Saponaria officinalis]|uniref:PsbP C-terminal domain-containing protein n=1 Tax=Saponaria officinalis TaxID=3572 RepID=A0AAW1HM25_SAPOF